MKKAVLNISSVFLTIFGLLTIFMGGSVIFDLFGIRAIEGHYVMFVVVANFLCGFLYILAAYGMFKRRSWTAWLLFLAVVILILTFIGLAIYIKDGGVYENKTLIAMTIRTFITLTLGLLAWYSINKNAYIRIKKNSGTKIE